ncbi:MAG TPA: AI-2E family transporter [Thermoanaerobaculia bacterium]|nr:AI-2E family transporter [Thermoanaerobaculia bacterium]
MKEARGAEERREAPPRWAAEEEPQLRWATILKIVTALALVWAVCELWQFLILCAFALLLATTAEPLVTWAERRGLARGVAVLLLGLIGVALIAAAMFFVAPPFVEQIQALLHNLGGLSRHVVEQVRPTSPFFAGVLAQVFELPHSPQVATWLRKPLLWGQVAVGAVVASAFAFMLMLYLIYHGRQTYAWLLAYMPRRHRQKMAETIPEVSDVVLAYMRAQIVTTLIFTAFAFAVLTIFHVPASLPLAVLAGICDVIPLIGIVIATTPAVLLALTVSRLAATAVLALYLLYAAFEGYVLVPRLYGRHLRLSPLVVLIALAVGGRLQGIAGALLILPLVAAYPIIERIWLSGYLGDHVLDDHSALEQAAPGEQPAVVDAVIQGVPHEESPTTPSESR